METIGDYRLEEELGRGGMGVVYRAHDPRLERTVAVKVLLVATEESKRARLLTEARSLARLRHPNIVEVFDIGVSGRFPYVVMEFVPGTTLQNRLDRSGPLLEGDAAAIVRKLAGAVDYAHASGVLHRDIKPDNVLVSEEGEPRLTDFGLAKDLRDSSGQKLSTTGQFLGTPGFWPPEQAQGQVARIGPASDVYALGATLFCLLTGRPPFLRASAWECALATVEEAPPSLASCGVDVSPQLEAICARCLQKAPADRFPSAGALAEALDAYARGDAEVARRSRLILGLSATLVAALLVAAGAGAATFALSPSKARVSASAPPRESATRPPPRASPSPAPSPTPDPAQGKAKLERELAKAKQDARRAEAKRLVDRGRVLTQVNGDWRGGIAAYTQAIAADPTCAEAYLGRASNKIGVEDYRGALEDLDEALRLDERSAGAHLFRGMAYLALRHPREALRDLDRALELDPKRADAYVYRGTVHLSARRFELAVADLTRALELLPPDDPSAPTVRQQLQIAKRALAKR